MDPPIIFTRNSINFIFNFKTYRSVCYVLRKHFFIIKKPISDITMHILQQQLQKYKQN